jgi:hypothetical protein
MKLFRSGLSPHHTALAMIGARSGNTVVIFGASDPALAAELALVTGLNGRTVVADSRDQTRASVTAAAEHAGALLDFELMTGGELPVERGTVDVVVLQQYLGTAAAGGERGILGEAMRLVRSGGRVVAIEGERRRGRLFGSPPPPVISGEAIVSLLSGAGLIAVRVLAEVESVVYVEGRKQ